MNVSTYWSTRQTAARTRKERIILAVAGLLGGIAYYAAMVGILL